MILYYNYIIVCYIILYYVLLCYVIFYYTILYYIILYKIVLYYTILYNIILDYIILSYNKYIYIYIYIYIYMIPAKFLILQPDPSHSKLTSGLIAPGPLQCNFPSASIVGSGCRLVPAQPWPIWEKPAAGAGKNSTRFPFPSAPSLSNEFRGAPSCQISPNLGSWNSLHVQIQAVTQCPNPPRPGSDWYQHHPPLHLRRPPHVHVSVSAEAPSSGMMRIGHALGSTRDTWKCSIDDNWWLEIPQDHEWLENGWKQSSFQPSMVLSPWSQPPPGLATLAASFSALLWRPTPDTVSGPTNGSAQTDQWKNAPRP